MGRDNKFSKTQNAIRQPTIPNVACPGARMPAGLFLPTVRLLEMRRRRTGREEAWGPWDGTRAQCNGVRFAVSNRDLSILDSVLLVAGCVNNLYNRKQHDCHNSSNWAKLWPYKTRECDRVGVEGFYRTNSVTDKTLAKSQKKGSRINLFGARMCTGWATVLGIEPFGGLKWPQARALYETKTCLKGDRWKSRGGQILSNIACIPQNAKMSQFDLGL